MSPVLGILGGLGPHAHLAFERMLLEACPVVREQDYPSWVVWSAPGTPDRTAALLGQGPSPVPALRRGLEALAQVADLAVIPCNTAHAFLPALGPLPLPLLDMVQTTVDALQDARCIGILGTTGTLRTGIYPAAAPDRRWCSLLDLPSGRFLHQTLVMETIYGVSMAGGAPRGGIKHGARHHPDTGRAHADALHEATARLLDAGADVVVAGCTEISAALPPTPGLVDPLRTVARAALARLGHHSPSPARPAAVWDLRSPSEPPASPATP